MIHSTDHYNYWRIWPKIINWSLIEMISFNEARNVNVNGRTILKMSFIICWFIYYYTGLFNCSDKHLGKMFNHSLLCTWQFSDRTVWAMGSEFGAEVGLLTGGAVVHLFLEPHSTQAWSNLLTLRQLSLRLTEQQDRERRCCC